MWSDSTKMAPKIMYWKWEHWRWRRWGWQRTTWSVVEQNPCQNVRETSQQTFDVSTATVLCHIYRALESIGKGKKNNKRIPHELNEHQKLRRFKVCVTPMIPFLTELPLVTKSESFMIILYDHGQWLDRDEFRKFYPKLKLHHQNIMVTVW